MADIEVFRHVAELKTCIVFSIPDITQVTVAEPRCGFCAASFSFPNYDEPVLISGRYWTFEEAQQIAEARAAAEDGFTKYPYRYGVIGLVMWPLVERQAAEMENTNCQ